MTEAHHTLIATQGGERLHLVLLGRAAPPQSAELALFIPRAEQDKPRTIEIS